MNKFSLVVATDLNNGIGKNNTLPWKLKGDMTYFKNLTIYGMDKIKHMYSISNSPEDKTVNVKNLNIPPFKEWNPTIDLTNVVIMGRNTWESIPDKFRPLNSRINVIVSSKPADKIHSDAVFVTSLDDAFSPEYYFPYILDRGELLVIGGASIYAQAMNNPNCQYIYITRINAEFDCDTFFPDYTKLFKKVASSVKVEENSIEYTFEIWERI